MAFDLEGNLLKRHLFGTNQNKTDLVMIQFIDMMIMITIMKNNSDYDNYVKDGYNDNDNENNNATKNANDNYNN